MKSTTLFAAIQKTPEFPVKDKWDWPDYATNPSYKLDNIETTAKTAKFVSYIDERRKSHLDEFEIIWKFYNHFDNHPDHRKSDLLSSCGSNAIFYRHIETGEVRICSNKCHLRWCPMCANDRKCYISHSVAEWLRDAKYPKLLTLTVKHVDLPLDVQIDNLYRCFRKLRSRKDFKTYIAGGIWHFQVKLGKKDKLWHPHIHFVADGKFFPRKQLQRMWSETTGDSHVVDVQEIRDPERAAKEVARYAATSANLARLDFEHGCELFKCMHGRRTCGTWGTGRAVSLRPPKLDDKKLWENVGSWYNVVKNRESNSKAKAIWKAWHLHEPLADGISMSFIDTFHDDLLDDGPSRSPPVNYKGLYEKPIEKAFAISTQNSISNQF